MFLIKMLQYYRVIFTFILGSYLVWTTQALADDSLTILPETVSLTGPHASQRLLVEELKNGNLYGQVTEGVTFHSSNPKVVRLENGVAFPVGNGKATITATFGKRSASVSVKVDQQESKKGWSFRNHVQPVLAKTGCNSGACHGAASGKNGSCAFPRKPASCPCGRFPPVRPIASGTITCAGKSVLRPRRYDNTHPACGVLIPPVNNLPVCII